MFVEMDNKGGDVKIKKKIKKKERMENMKKEMDIVGDQNNFNFSFNINFIYIAPKQ